MSAFSIRKQPPKQSDNKSPSVAIKSRQQVIQDINKRRTLLQDNSWIKKRSEEESADENYGRAVLNQYKSQDSLHSSSTNEKEDQKALLGRYRSDTTLDRIPARSDVDKINKFPILDNKQSNRQPWTPTTSSTNTAVTSPIKKKRQSWMPPPVLSCKTTTDTVETKDFNTSASYSNPRDTGVYTRTFEENSKSSHGAYEENITGNTIKTVYSTSDQSIIGKDICTYCRKPLGIDAKMVLDALQICCHSTCFKCEVCKRPLEDLKAGDSIWIYRQTVHCEPCYSKVREKWIY
ncbi:sciellin isoform X1 [Apteryx mantelli]|uniref:Sciellin isoform X1 n=1 Tax=Apteryx mantelli TaxID=2696672 RepID=A0A8B7J9X2_9AVES|nr:PREDICTED: sciellin isoform X1 [Apteryx mantelli mantelli]